MLSSGLLQISLSLSYSNSIVSWMCCKKSDWHSNIALRRPNIKKKNHLPKKLLHMLKMIKCDTKIIISLLLPRIRLNPHQLSRIAPKKWPFNPPSSSSPCCDTLFQIPISAWFCVFRGIILSNQHDYFLPKCTTKLGFKEKITGGTC